jgi:energy-coupling factor transporter transmembrane protein EcfT
MVLAWLLFLRILPSTFFLNFLSYTTSVAGVFLGLVGSAMYVRLNKKE